MKVVAVLCLWLAVVSAIDVGGRKHEEVAFNKAMHRLRNIISKAEDVLSTADAPVDRFAEVGGGAATHAMSTVDSTSTHSSGAASHSSHSGTASHGGASTHGSHSHGGTSSHGDSHSHAGSHSHGGASHSGSHASGSSSHAGGHTAAHGGSHPAARPAPKTITPGPAVVIDEPGQPNTFGEVKPFVVPQTQSYTAVDLRKGGKKLVEPHYLITPLDAGRTNGVRVVSKPPAPITSVRPPSSVVASSTIVHPTKPKATAPKSTPKPTPKAK